MHRISSADPLWKYFHKQTKNLSMQGNPYTRLICVDRHSMAGITSARLKWIAYLSPAFNKHKDKIPFTIRMWLANLPKAFLHTLRTSVDFLKTE